MRSRALLSRLAITGTSIAAATSIYLSTYLAHTPSAEACGCFAPPDPSVPIVQAGERIAFAMKNGVVTAHIQIQYSGDAEEFAWLVPMPAIPEVGVGTDELFAQLISTTQPKYRVNRVYQGTCSFDPSRSGSDGAFPDGGAPPPSSPGEGSGSPLVLRDTVGPYDYAVLSAENKQPMLDWLQQERFFVPAGTDEAVNPYIRPGAYFLALKLRKGQSSGDLQPVVVKYQSQLPMIPIVLTSVAAEPDMGVLVWVLGESRAIPRNYFHTIINDALINWLTAGSNYVEVITRAVDEADGHHSFVTEYAGTSAIMVDRLDYSGRFGDLAELRTITDAIDYVDYLLYNGYAVWDFFGAQFSSQILTILQRELPVPSALLEAGVTPNDYYTNLSWYLGWYREDHPDLFLDLDIEYDPIALSDELEQRVVQPTLDAGQMFRENSYMTRLFTTLSPEEMTKDPVFSFNPDLPPVSNIREATLTYFCGFGSDNQGTTPAQLVTEQGWVLSMPDGEANFQWPDVDMPASQFTQVLREEGQPETVGDNTASISSIIDQFSASLRGGGCAVDRSAGKKGLSGLILLGFVAAMIIRRRRR
jgi:hypothetical protein